jgi:hypothetical protein
MESAPQTRNNPAAPEYPNWLARQPIMKFKSMRTSVALNVAVWMLLAFLQPMLADDDHTSFLNPDVLKTVVSMEQLDSPTNSRPIGTGFILETTNHHFILVTAKHVILDEQGKVNPSLGWRLNEKTNVSDLVPDKQQSAFLGGWFLSTNADLACRFIAYGNESDFRAIPHDFLLRQKKVEPAAHIVIVGFPMGLRSEQYTTPILRSGIVARSATNELMLDAFVFPGNSGGPVVYVPTIRMGSNLHSPLINDERVIGIVTDYIPFTDVGISPQTKRPRIVFEENSGLCHAVPADRLIELMSLPDFIAFDNKR